MKFLLDTNVCIDVLRGRADVIARFRKHSPDKLHVSAVTAFELIQGAGRAPQAFRAIERQKVNTLLTHITTIQFDRECGILAGEINANLLNAGTSVGIMDVFIAATALRMKLPLVTNNARDFSKIKALKLFDWRGKAS